jgi:hypothetical protein
MAALPIIGTIVSGISSIVSSIFKTKEVKAQAIASGIQGTVDLLKQADATDAQIATAIAAGVTAESQSEGVLTRNWRPLVMLLITMLIVAWCFGYIPPNINAPMPPFIEECFEILKFGLGFYMSGRSLEKIAKTLLTPKLIETMLKNISK